MVNEELKKWVEDLPSCLEDKDHWVRERHMESLVTDGWCGACGRVTGDYKVEIQGGVRLRVWTDDHDNLLAVDLGRRLIVWPEAEKHIKREV